MKQSIRSNGFTLIELSIVLVIIALIIGGIVAGKELIHRATINRQVAELHHMETLIGTFKSKYDCFPGRCTNGESLGLGTSTTNMQFLEVSLCGDQTNCNGESEEQMYFLQLRASGLFDEPPEYVPPAESYIGYCSTAMGHCAYVERGDTTHRGTFLMLVRNTDDCGGDDNCAGFKTMDAWSLDQKLDDGLPRQGKFLAYGDYDDFGDETSNSLGVAGAEVCAVNTVTPYTYNLAVVSDNLCSGAYRIMQ
jgi:prepilin-type N-terminal cleavage/methylation domain-containing protein